MAKTGGEIGAVGGVASGLAGTASGAATGAEIVGVVGFCRSGSRQSCRAIFGALVVAATGGVTKAKLGEVVDQRMLDNCVAR